MACARPSRSKRSRSNTSARRGPPGRLMREYAPQLAAMHAVLCPPGGTTGGRRCDLPAAPLSLEVRASGKVKIKGPLGLGATATETFLMEAAEGWPKDQVAWGRLADDAVLMNLLSI